LAWFNQQPPEPAALTWARHESAYLQHRNGVPLPAIAAQVNATPQEVQSWLDERERIQDEAHELVSALRRKSCAKCGGKLEPSYTDAGGTPYHPECWRILCYGK
jgi:hypothetical protein